jgi:hypothetical protein
MSSPNAVITALCGLADSVAAISLLAVTTMFVRPDNHALPHL